MECNDVSVATTIVATALSLDTQNMNELTGTGIFQVCSSSHINGNIDMHVEDVHDVTVDPDAETCGLPHGSQGQ